MFERIEQEIKTLREKEKNLASIIQKIDNATCFDEEDSKVIQKELSVIKENLNQVEVLLRHKKEIYNNHVVDLEKRILERSTTLNSVTHFQEFPDLLRFFAHKQNDLDNNLQDIKKQLSD